MEIVATSWELGHLDRLQHLALVHEDAVKQVRARNRGIYCRCGRRKPVLRLYCSVCRVELRRAENARLRALAAGLNQDEIAASGQRPSSQ